MSDKWEGLKEFILADLKDRKMLIAEMIGESNYISAGIQRVVARREEIILAEIERLEKEEK